MQRQAALVPRAEAATYKRWKLRKILKIEPLDSMAGPWQAPPASPYGTIPLYLDRRPGGGGQDDPCLPARRTPRRAARDGAGGGESVPRELLRGPPQARLPDPGLLPALAIPAAAGPVPARPIQPGDDRGLPLREGPDLRGAEPRSERARALRASLRAPRRSDREARPRRLPAGASRGAPAAHPPPRARFRAPSGAGVPPGPGRGLQRLLLPLRGDAAPRREHERHRPRRLGFRRGRPRRRHPAPSQGDAALQPGALIRTLQFAAWQGGATRDRDLLVRAGPGDGPAPEVDMSSQSAGGRKRLTIADLRRMKGAGEKIAMVSEYDEVIRRIVRAGVPVMGHIGLTPQSVHAMGGYVVQGKDPENAQRLLRDAKALEEAGCFAMVLECIPAELARFVTGHVRIPTVGIGAGPHCDGQVLVVNDLLGLDGAFKPKFFKRYAELGGSIEGAVGAYVNEVRGGAFPSDEHSFHSPTTLRLLHAVDERPDDAQVMGAPV